MGEFGKPMMKLYYNGDAPQEKFSAFVAKHDDIRSMIEGKW
jgi:hypothetical protein